MIEIDPMTRVKDLEIEQDITAHMCPYCNFYYDDYILLDITYKENGEIKKIRCVKCNEDVTIFFLDKFIN